MVSRKRMFSSSEPRQNWPNLSFWRAFGVHTWTCALRVAPTLPLPRWSFYFIAEKNFPAFCFCIVLSLISFLKRPRKSAGLELQLFNFWLKMNLAKENRQSMTTQTKTPNVGIHRSPQQKIITITLLTGISRVETPVGIIPPKKVEKKGVFQAVFSKRDHLFLYHTLKTFLIPIMILLIFFPITVARSVNMGCFQVFVNWKGVAGVSYPSRSWSELWRERTLSAAPSTKQTTSKNHARHDEACDARKQASGVECFGKTS